MVRAAWLAALFLFFALAFGWWRHSVEPSGAPSSVSTPPPPPPPGVNPAAARPAPGNRKAPPAPPEVAAAFTQYLESESKQVDALHVDAAAAQAQLDQQAGQMGAPEVAYARTLALTEEAPADERILALALLNNPHASATLTAAARRDLVLRHFNSARAAPDTAEEYHNVQNKSGAIWTIDEQAARAATDPAARAELERWGAQAQDSTIRNHIAEKLRGLPPR